MDADGIQYCIRSHELDIFTGVIEVGNSSLEMVFRIL